MPLTMLDRVGHSVIHKKLENPIWVSSLLSCVKKYEIGFFPDWYLSILFQLDPADSQFTIYDAYGVLRFHADLGSGNIVYATIDLGEMPSRDKHEHDNNNKLMKLWHPFRGYFWGGNQNEDGEIFVDEPIELSVITVEGCEITQHISGRFPLEVGTTSIYKTLLYLNSGFGKLARWPYYSDKIYLLARRLNK